MDRKGQRRRDPSYLGRMDRTTSLSTLLFFLSFPLLLFGQDGTEAFKRGYQAHREGAYEKALRHYGRAIQANDSLKKAYYNRASVRIVLDRYEKAKEDLDRTIELDPDYLPAYYNRANIHTRNAQYEKAHEDLNRILKRKKEHRKALLLRGQVRQHLNEKEAGCRDLKRAEKLGASKASEHFREFCQEKAPLDLESRWPERENWKIVQRDDGKDRKRIQLVPEEESFPGWEHLGVATALKKIRGIPMDTARYFLKRQAKGKCKDAEVRTLEKGEDHIFFTLSCSDHINTQAPETQLWYVEQGRRHLYAYFVAIRKPEMSKNEREKWMRFFRE